jgi:hypothetical protein
VNQYHHCVIKSKHNWTNNVPTSSLWHM